jgi:hypothetical protein
MVQLGCRAVFRALPIHCAIARLRAIGSVGPSRAFRQERSILVYKTRPAECGLDVDRKHVGSKEPDLTPRSARRFIGSLDVHDGEPRPIRTQQAALSARSEMESLSGDHYWGKASSFLPIEDDSSLSGCDLVVSRNGRHRVEYAVASDERMEKRRGNMQQDQGKEHERKIEMRIPEQRVQAVAPR